MGGWVIPPWADLLVKMAWLFSGKICLILCVIQLKNPCFVWLTTCMALCLIALTLRQLKPERKSIPSSSSLMTKQNTS